MTSTSPAGCQSAAFPMENDTPGTSAAAAIISGDESMPSTNAFDRPSAINASTSRSRALSTASGSSWRTHAGGQLPMASRVSRCILARRRDDHYSPQDSSVKRAAAGGIPQVWNTSTPPAKRAELLYKPTGLLSQPNISSGQLRRSRRQRRKGRSRVGADRGWRAPRRRAPSRLKGRS
jgi:hypothetical protein